MFVNSETKRRIMTYNKPEIVTLSSPIKAVQNHQKIDPSTVFDTMAQDYVQLNSAYNADE